jgi:hypothetical protein
MFLVNFRADLKVSDAATAVQMALGKNFDFNL